MNKYAAYFFGGFAFAIGFPMLVAFLINSHSTFAIVLLLALVSVGLGFILNLIIKKVSTKNED